MIATGPFPVAQERLLAATFTEGAAIGDVAVLQGLAADVGLEPEQVRTVLATDAYAAGVRADERRAAALGISAVPFFVIDGRYGVAGARPSDELLDVLEEAWVATQAEQPPVAPSAVSSSDVAPGCSDDACTSP